MLGAVLHFSLRGVFGACDLKLQSADAALRNLVKDEHLCNTRDTTFFYYIASFMVLPHGGLDQCRCIFQQETQKPSSCLKISSSHIFTECSGHFRRPHAAFIYLQFSIRSKSCASYVKIMTGDVFSIDSVKNHQLQTYKGVTHAG